MTGVPLNIFLKSLSKQMLADEATGADDIRNKN